jgi:hydroxyacylglutathione hydrolase
MCGRTWRRFWPARSARLSELWLTHGHWDHTQGGAEVVRATPGLKVRAHRDDQVLIETPAGDERVSSIASDQAGADQGRSLARARRVGLNGPRLRRSRCGTCRGIARGTCCSIFVRAGAAFVGDALFQGQHRPDRSAAGQPRATGSARSARRFIRCRRRRP